MSCKQRHVQTFYEQHYKYVQAQNNTNTCLNLGRLWANTDLPPFPPYLNAIIHFAPKKQLNMDLQICIGQLFALISSCFGYNWHLFTCIYWDGFIVLIDHILFADLFYFITVYCWFCIRACITAWCHMWRVFQWGTEWSPSIYNMVIYYLS